MATFFEHAFKDKNRMNILWVYYMLSDKIKLFHFNTLLLSDKKQLYHFTFFSQSEQLLPESYL